MSDGHFSFASLISSRDEYEESFWPSFTDVMMVITMIFLLVTVAVVLTNTRLLDELRHSLLSEQSAQEDARKAELEARKAAQEAEFQLKANATLEEQLDYLQQRSATLEMELLRSRAATEEARRSSEEQQTELKRLQTLNQEQSEALARRDQTLNDLQAQFTDIMTEREQIQSELASATAERERAQAELTAARDSAENQEEALSALREKVDESEKQLLSLQGEYSELDQKYQKLLKPSRSSKGKQVAEVIYRRGGYTLSKPGESGRRSVSRSTLESELSELKSRYGAELYVKIIIPENSGLSYNEAWKFTSDMLNKYDYYYQQDNSKPAD